MAPSTSPTNKGPPRTLQTERLLLRPLDPEQDAADVHEWYRQEDAVRWTTNPVRKEVSETLAKLHQRVSDPHMLMYAITVLRDPDGPAASSSSSPSSSFSPSSRSEPAARKVIGLVGSKHPPEIGYSLNPAYQRRGYMGEALRAFLPAMFDHLSCVAAGAGTGEIVALTDVDNVASQRLLRKLGFRRGRLVESEYYSPVLGERRDCVCWYLPREGREVPRWLLEGKYPGDDDEGPPVPDLQ